MNKQDLIGAVAKRLDVTRARAARDHRALLRAGRGDRDGAAAGRQGGHQRVRELRDPPARRARGRNPRTGKAITIKASIIPAFRAGKVLKDLVNRKRS